MLRAATSLASAVSAAIIAALALFGVACAQRVFERGATHHYITIVYYYTNLANVLVALCLAGYAVFAFTGAPWLAWTALPGVMFSVAPLVSVVMIVFHFVLMGGSFRNLDTCLARLHSRRFEAILLHYVVPFAVIVWWCVFLDHAGVVWFHALTWLAVPAAYLIFLVIFVRVHGPIGRRRSAWPYDFMDLDKLGLSRWICHIAGVACALCLLGFAFYGINLLFI